MKHYFLRVIRANWHDSIWHLYWHSIWHIFCHALKHIFWHVVLHSLWHSMWHYIWHSTSQICWHSIWHFWTFCLTLYLTFFLALELAFKLTYYLRLHLTFYLSIWHIFWHSIWHLSWHATVSSSGSPGARFWWSFGTGMTLSRHVDAAQSASNAFVPMGNKEKKELRQSFNWSGSRNWHITAWSWPLHMTLLILHGPQVYMENMVQSQSNWVASRESFNIIQLNLLDLLLPQFLQHGQPQVQSTLFLSTYCSYLYLILGARFFIACLLFVPRNRKHLECLLELLNIFWDWAKGLAPASWNSGLETIRGEIKLEARGRCER